MKSFLAVFATLCSECVDILGFMASSILSISFGMKYAGDWDAETVNGIAFLLFLSLVGYLWFTELVSNNPSK